MEMSIDLSSIARTRQELSSLRQRVERVEQGAAERWMAHAWFHAMKEELEHFSAACAHLLHDLVPHVHRSKGLHPSRVFPHDYCRRLMDVALLADALVKKAVRTTAEGTAPADVALYALWQLLKQGVGSALISISERPQLRECVAAMDSARSAGSEEVVGTFALSYVCMGIHQLLGTNLRKLWSQLIQLWLHDHCTALILPDAGACWTVPSPRLCVGVMFYLSCVRLDDNGICDSTTAIQWLSQLTQQLLWVCTTSHAVVCSLWTTDDERLRRLVENVTLALRVGVATIFDACVLRFGTHFIQYTKALGRALQEAHESVGSQGVRQRCLGLVRDVVGSSASPFLATSSLVRSGWCCCLHSANAVAPPLMQRAYMALAYVPSPLHFSDTSRACVHRTARHFHELVVRMDQDPSAEQMTTLMTIVQIDQLDGAVFNQLGLTQASQDRVIAGIMDVLERASRFSSDVVQYSLYHVAHAAVNQSSTPFFNATKHAVPVARVVCQICKNNPELNDLIVAQFYEHCPFTIPSLLEIPIQDVLSMVQGSKGTNDTTLYRTCVELLKAWKFDVDETVRVSGHGV